MPQFPALGESQKKQKQTGLETHMSFLFSPFSSHAGVEEKRPQVALLIMIAGLS